MADPLDHFLDGAAAVLGILENLQDVYWPRCNEGMPKEANRSCVRPNWVGMSRLNTTDRAVHLIDQLSPRQQSDTIHVNANQFRVAG